MNGILLKQRIDFYLNLSKNARFTFAEYAIAVNDVTDEYIDEQMGDEANRNPESFQWIQRISDDLYTLIKVAAPVVTPGTAVTTPYYSSLPSTFPVPSDYKTFVYMSCIIDGFTIYARPTTFNKLGPLLNDSFRKPSNTKIYFNSSAAGMTIWRANSGVFTSCSLTYIKVPTDFSIGQESNLINAPTALTVASYIATEVTVFMTVVYQVGAVIVGSVNPLTSGQVILASLVVPCELPPPVHEEIAKRAAVKLLAAVGDVQQSMVIQGEAEKSV